MKTAEEFLKGLSTYHEIFHINDDPEYSEEQTIRFAKEYADHVTTSQQVKIKYLKDFLGAIVKFYNEDNGRLLEANVKMAEEYLKTKER